jgi:hypothetical protein
MNIKGTNQEFAWHLLGAKADPEFIIRAAAIDRLVREIWERIKTKDHKTRGALGATHPCQEDVLTEAELCALAEAISDHKNKHKTGVCQILAEALGYFKIKLIREEGERFHTYLHTSLGEIDLEYATPALIKNFLVKIYDKQSSVVIAGKLGVEGGTENIFYTRHIKKAFCKASVSQRRRILRNFSGNVHTNQSGQEMGYAGAQHLPFRSRN